MAQTGMLPCPSCAMHSTFLGGCRSAKAFSRYGRERYFDTYCRTLRPFFAIPSNLLLYGRLVGRSTRTARNIAAHGILSGDLEGNDGAKKKALYCKPPSIRHQPGHTVINVTAVASIFDGWLIVTAGKAGNPHPSAVVLLTLAI